MKLYPFVFSNKQNYRLSRHALFWFIWILYYSFMSAVIMPDTYGFSKSFFESFVEVAESTPLDMCFCYFIIYYLLPEFLFKRRYISMLMLWLLASIMFVIMFELNLRFVSSAIRQAFGLSFMASRINYAWDFFTLFSQINMEGCLAASIKLGKLWYIKQEEINLLKQEKDKIQPHEEQHFVQPAFLADLLKRMEIIANENPLLAAQSIKKIHKLLLYVLYENAASQVSLQKELLLLQEYIDLEKLTAQQKIEIKTSIQKVSGNETIAPSIVMPLAENAFKQALIYKLENAWINVDIKLSQDILNAEISWSKPVDTSSLLNGRNVVLHNILKRLKLIYPQSHELKMMIEAESIIVTLKLDLKKAIN